MSAPFILRPVATTLLIVAIVLLGVIGYRALPVAALPTGLLPGPPTYHMVNPADAPVMILALTSDTLPLHLVNDYAATTIIQKLSQVSGVGAVTVEGGQTRAVRLQVNPVQLAGLGLS